MDTLENTPVWPQFGAALDMLERAVQACPEGRWAGGSGPAEFWYLTYHTLFWLDVYLSGAVEGFAPPAPFGLEELDPAGRIPERPYTRAELLAYLEHGRRKCRAVCEALAGERARERCRFRWGEVSFLELQVYNLRHVQHHVGQLNLLLRQAGGPVPRWVTRAGAGRA